MLRSEAPRAAPAVSTTDLHRRQLDRLKRLGVEFSTLPRADHAVLLRRFADAFVDPARRQDFLLAIAGARPLDYDRYLRAEHIRALVPLGGSLSWLSGGRTAARCHRLERRASLPALDLLVATIEDTWATSWPGMLVSFPAGRALIITLDYERIHCDLQRATPYR